MDAERFRHDRSAYERPNLAYRCGRAAEWGAPCARGANADGSCGGTADCAPFQNATTQRWECRRSSAAGGPCEEGPGSDGSCAHRRQACRPRPTLRRWRGRLTWLAVLTVVVLIAAAFNLKSGSDATFSAINPGNLSGIHARFTAEQGCGACHEAHDGSALRWITAAFRTESISTQCITCHSFGGPERAPHNLSATPIGIPEQVRCTACHTEHRGLTAKTTTITDSQCNTCHDVKFTSFGKDHPPFGKDFPYRLRTSIQFDHATHFGKHFGANPIGAPREGCISCHDVERGTWAIPIRGFEGCSLCHTQKIVDHDIVAVAMPELSPAQFLALGNDALIRACGTPDEKTAGAFAEAKAAATKAVEDNDPQGDFLPVSDLKLTPFQQLILDIDGDAIVEREVGDDESAAVLDLLRAMVKGGSRALVAGVDQRLGDGRAGGLLAGLSTELVHRVGCGWALNAEVKIDPPPGGGWYANGLQLRYKPTGHADPVVRAWLEFALDPSLSASQHERDRVYGLTRELIDPQGGPGNCVSCHAVSATQAGGKDALKEPGPNDLLGLHWKARATGARSHVRYSHRPHVNLLGPGKECEQCHVLDPQAQYSEGFGQLNPHHYTSNFKQIRVEQCTTCHGAGQVRNDCLTCHEYHREPGFQRMMMVRPGQGE